MKSPTKIFISVLLLTCNIVLALSHASTTSAEHPSLAIARPFTLSDADQLPESFETWKDFPPCREGSTVKFDLFLVYSRSLEDAIQAQVSIRAVEAMIEEGEDWSSCISQVIGFGVDIDASEDLYRLDLQKSDPLWVNGPNRQFERTIRAVQMSEYGSYDLMYFMEMDSVPVQPYWLDALMEGIRRDNSEFAILGSKYKGYKWEAFISELPQALVNHINGNAFYNLTHPLLEAIVQQLESESGTAANSIPYDYRIAQMVEEVETGEVPMLFTLIGDDEAIPQDFFDLISAFDLEELIRDTPLMGDYARTNMLPSLIGDDEVVIHGARMFAPWNRSNLGEISLVVSDWVPVASQAMLSSLDSSKHPFMEAIVVTPEDAQHDHLVATSIPVSFAGRGNMPDTADLCTVDVATPWFIMSNSFFQLRGDMEIMTNVDHRPIISFQEPTYESCFSDDTCNRDFALAQELVPNFSAVFYEFDFVFHTETRNEYCQFVQAMNNATWSNTPGVNSYVAYLQRTGQWEKLYATSDRTMYGSRQMFVEREKSTLDYARLRGTVHGRKLRVLQTCTNVNDPYACPGGGGGVRSKKSVKKGRRGGGRNKYGKGGGKGKGFVQAASPPTLPAGVTTAPPLLPGTGGGVVTVGGKGKRRRRGIKKRQRRQ